MRIVVVDTEVFKYDWIAVFLDTVSGEFQVFHNDNQAVRDYMDQSGLIFCGYNSKHYDNHILKAICCGAPPELVKQINDFIIVEERPGWEHWFIRQNRFWFDSFDLMDDTQVGTSLKHIEAHMGWNIEHTEVDFNLNRPLTPEEIESTIFYCKWDVKATAKLLTMRKGYLQAKLNVARTKGISDAKALYMTNARLTAAFLDAVATERFDEREYHYPDNLDRTYIPDEVFDFFNGIHNTSIPSKEYFSSKLKLNIGDCEVVLGFGGIHGAIQCYVWEEEKDDLRTTR
jgi:hypothetical protein